EAGEIIHPKMGAMAEAVPGKGDKILGRPPRPRLVALINWSAAECLPVRGGRHMSERTPVQIWHYQAENAPGLEHPQRITQRRGQLVPCKVFKHVTAINSTSAVIRDRQTAYYVPEPDVGRK